MSEHEQEDAVPLNEEQLQDVREGTPEREEDSLDFSTEEESVQPTQETPEEALLGTPVRAEDDLIPEEAVEETAPSTEQESEHEAVSPEGQGAEGHNPDPS